MTDLQTNIANSAYTLEMLAACAAFVLPLKKRSKPVAGFLAGAFVCMGLSVCLGSSSRAGMISAVLLYLFQLSAVLLPVIFCCDVSFSDAVYGTLCAYAMQHFASSLYIFVCVWNDYLNFQNAASPWISRSTLPFYIIVYTGTYLAFYLLAARPLGKQREYRANLLQSGGLSMLVIPIALALSLIGKLSDIGRTGLLLMQVYAMLCCAFVLWAQVAQRRMIALQRDIAIQEQLWENQREQYRISRTQIDLINQKCHDLKHQIAALRTVHSEAQREESLREAEQAVMIYDSSIRTGNDVLDTVLTEKSLICEKERIQWTCMADGSRLNFLNPVDLYAIFGNALDNAIESVRNLQEPEKRVIAVTVFHRGGLAVLQIENYYDGTLRFQDGLPLSEKGDDAYHGFGMKSIRRTVEKYDGSIAVRTEDQIFILSVVFPLPSPPD